LYYQGGVGKEEKLRQAVFGAFSNHVAFGIKDINLCGFKTVLAAMGFISKDNDIMAIANLGIEGFAISRGKFLDGGKNDTA